MIELHQFAPAFGLPNPSPFCMKVEGLLRLAGLPFTTVIEPDPRKAPRGKLPFIVVDGTTLSDSAVITTFLRDEYGIDLDDHLDATVRATHRAFQALLEERLYWTVIQQRWLEDSNWPLVRDTFFVSVPPGIRSLVSRLARAKVRRDLKGQGLSLHDPGFIVSSACDDWQALSSYLGREDYFGGNRPCLLDVVALSVLANALRGYVRSAVRDYLATDARLLAYAQRGMQRVFGTSLG